MQSKITVGELAVRFLEQCGVRAAIGVISINNMPILDSSKEEAQRGSLINLRPGEGSPGHPRIHQSEELLLGFERSAEPLGALIRLIY